ncbi:MAG: hercynylcysteine S-oxide lyase [Mycobacterium sp.]|nr:hercynylcysteine S-oxide lyase [Mycobacterium sp.]
MTGDSSLPRQWRESRPTPAGVHLDSAACSRQSYAAIDAAASHARREAEVGGYVAAQEAEETLADGRSAVAALTGMTADDVVFTTGAEHALDLLLAAWPGERRVIACIPGEFAPNLAVMVANGFTIVFLPVDSLGRVELDRLATQLSADAPSLVHLTVVPSHRGIVQPLHAIAATCLELGVPLVVDAAQGLGQVDCAVEADAIYATSRKWLAGPRGVGVLAVRPERAETLRPRLPPPDWDVDLAPMRKLELGEANLAARVGFSVAVTEYMAYGPVDMRAALADAGRLTRAVLSDLTGWRVVEPEDSPTAITTLAATDGADVVEVRAELIAQHSVATTVAGPDRAPFELALPVLRVSPYIDVTEEDLTVFARALRSVSAVNR